MAITCPECLSLLPADDGVCVVCPACKTEFTVLFRRAPKQAVAPRTQSPIAEGNCFRHPNAAATTTCAACGVAICQTCAFPAAEPGRSYCPDCAVVRPAALGAAGGLGPVPTGAPTAALGTKCRRHPEVQAIHLCANCQTPVCRTCDFQFGTAHLCPSCATVPAGTLSPKRRKLVWAAMALAIWSTLAMVLMCGGAALFFLNESDGSTFAGVMAVLAFVPSIVGGALGLACLDRRLGNPPIVLVAAIWNGLLMSLWLILVVIGVLTGG